MIRTFLRIVAYFALAVAVITAILDIAQSVADSAVIIKPLGTAWLEFSQGTLNASQAFIVSFVHPIIWDPIIQTILLAPSWAVFGGIWLTLSLATNRRRNKFVEKFNG